MRARESSAQLVFTIWFAVTVTLIVPPNEHFKLLMAFTAGKPERFTVVLVPDHGGMNWGKHGIGVSVPIAADVAAETVGFAVDVHIPKVGKTEKVALESFKAGAFDVMIVGRPIATTQGASPLSHMHVEPELTIVLIAGAAAI